MSLFEIHHKTMNTTPTDKHTEGPLKVFRPILREGVAGNPGIDNEDHSFTIVVFGGEGEEDAGIQGRTPEEALANARRLVHCWNCHDLLVELLESQLSRCEEELGFLQHRRSEGEPLNIWIEEKEDSIASLKQALQQARAAVGEGVES